MQRFICVQFLGAVRLFSLLFFCATVAQAQVDIIYPNPALPRDVGGSLNGRSFSDSGFYLGRANPRDPNPAETLLKSMDGTNYGRVTGHSLFPRSARARNAERHRNDPKQAVDVRRTAVKIATPISERGGTIGTAHAPRITGTKDRQKDRQ